MRAAVVGCGPRGLEHAGALRQVDGVELVALADSDESARRRGAELGVPARASLEELLAEDAPELLVLATPPRGRLGLVQHAADSSGVRGLVVEKPLALTLDEAERTVSACERSAVALPPAGDAHPAPPWTTHQLAFENGVRAVVETGALYQRGSGFFDDWLAKRVVAVGTHGSGEAHAAGGWRIVTADGGVREGTGGPDTYAAATTRLHEDMRATRCRRGDRPVLTGATPWPASRPSWPARRAPWTATPRCFRSTGAAIRSQSWPLSARGGPRAGLPRRAPSPRANPTSRCCCPSRTTRPHAGLPAGLAGADTAARALRAGNRLRRGRAGSRARGAGAARRRRQAGAAGRGPRDRPLRRRGESGDRPEGARPGAVRLETLALRPPDAPLCQWAFWTAAGFRPPP